MKLRPADRSPITGPDGHVVREIAGLTSLNLSKYSVAHIVAPARSRGVPRENQFDEIVIGISGRGLARRDHVTDELGPTDVLLLPAGTRYSIDASDEEDFEFWAVCVPAFRPEWSSVGTTKRDWRDYQTPRGADRLRFGQQTDRDEG
jgi:mannose-6-phosphate isomerase-like protein (cupin superfamily)